MYGSNYKDFFQKALIPIGQNDLNCLKNMEICDFCKHSHWLIALEGNLKSPDVEYYIWKVTIYPSDSNGSFSWNTPYYSSPIYDSIHKAYDQAKTLEKCSKNDKLHSIQIQESAG
ncbi:hypothetical protein F7731_06745 [Cytobacillus depressus]|uniref:Uncharacterized protein n=1 Tax=Cytobacillus depressus TaxID=1602942 RepID=A0A6L3V7H8_9BACI|nr:hypothetical protein [Cytobacillus depressus]KAB2337306.1 hypothetical protein F7731_06745 [Cytobacillus depressus]